VKQLIPVSRIAALVVAGASGGWADEVRAATPPNAAGGWQRFEFASPHMGTVWKLTVYSQSQTEARAARDDVWKEVAAIDEALSDYRDDNALAEFCRRGRIARDRPGATILHHAMARSVTIARETDGAFDPTVGPLVKLWREMRRTKRLVALERIEAARARVGWHAIRRIERAGDTAPEFELARAGMQLDFGGIGKGYAQDAARRVLESRGLKHFLIDAGGGALAGEPPPGRKGWNVALEPDEDAGTAEIIPLKNAALATSGDAHQFVEINGTRYSHIVDPATGLGLTTPIEANVVAPDATTADALATAFCVMGETKVRAFLKSHPGVHARLTVRQADGRLRVWESAGFGTR
jgi:thiamine biosynthesis lipoprotein